ncbi:5-methyltetrahydropteroyltriglutamate--homocysteine S-methyltransferase [Alkalicoccus luteus]|uniref:5-methyltetrahydropteroyltriglutamate--homocysteine methyltransferase n=1 Tax=Alkalicoccus luteus TaxID=1237094 RepID=A0A969PRS8_9BACI|nr:5-methyltetrahydropteroyltriglutamate--homocysteine S-methyltransferase [Alkalicoccus luteus]NJP39207.1 5-methyltetrahydropteroyltriglutamate--homocysteine S-methyltransferase [Alkalicoccus luteus]
MKTSVQGYPRIGENREWKRALEAYWKEEITAAELQEQMKAIRLERLTRLEASGLDLVPTGDFSYYDHMLDTAFMFNLVPERFASLSGNELDQYFAAARGTSEAPAMEMTKWFDTNYHYIVPELEDSWVPDVTRNYPLEQYREAEAAGIKTKPVLVGPYTFMTLAKGLEAEHRDSCMSVLLSLYAKVIVELYEAGAPLIQLDEPALVTSLTREEAGQAAKWLQQLLDLVPKAPLQLQTYFESLTHWDLFAALPFHAFGLDLMYDDGDTLQQLRQHPPHQNAALAIGVIDGRNVWKSDLREAQQLVHSVQSLCPENQLILQPSCSLLHVPVSLKQEERFVEDLKQGMAFADEKLQELQLLKQVCTGAPESTLDDHQASLSRFRKRYPAAGDTSSEKLAMREPVFSRRAELQQARWQLPLLPTTTIGSLPQTTDMRKARTAYRRGELSAKRYRAMVEEKMQRWIKLQEDIGLDVLVHGEFERNDMVEFFGEKLDGMAVTQNGWVQSYGSRCVKPPLIYGAVSAPGSMTVSETAYAQSLTDRPVKGMLTGPVTILKWSFERSDVPKSVTAYQLAEALQQEVEALEEAGIGMIQIDEPALREGFPLKREKRAHYLDWAVNSFRAASAVAQPETQIHTHMCYSDFHDMIDAISAMDADVISIETSRSHGGLIQAFEDNTYDKGIGLGVYDIHSPRIPPVQEMTDMIERCLNVLPAFQFWVNPDCGLKTRNESETEAALRNMQQAAETVRETLIGQTSGV